MAPTDQKTKNEKFAGKEGDLAKTKSGAKGVKKKRKWISDQKLFKGSVKEGTIRLNVHVKTTQSLSLNNIGTVRNQFILRSELKPCWVNSNDCQHKSMSIV